jgi:NhaP-type Na+/H+ and K+/H+ antiporter
MRPPSHQRNDKHFCKALALMGAAIMLALLPAPAGLALPTWYFFAIFAGVIVGLIRRGALKRKFLSIMGTSGNSEMKS